MVSLEAVAAGGGVRAAVRGDGRIGVTWELCRRGTGKAVMGDLHYRQREITVENAALARPG